MQEHIGRLVRLKRLVKEVHWNAQGRGFAFLHDYLDRVDENIEYHIDRIAEHMVVSGLYGLPAYQPDLNITFPTLLVEEDADSVRRGISKIVTALTDLVEGLDEALAETNGDDFAGEHVLVDAYAIFSKHLWLLSNEV